MNARPLMFVGRQLRTLPGETTMLTEGVTGVNTFSVYAPPCPRLFLSPHLTRSPE